MKTQVHPHSITAYHGIDLTRRQAEVVRALKTLKNATDQQIADFLDIGINRVTGRITELRAKGVIIEVGRFAGRFGKLVRITRLVNFEEELL